MGINKIEQINTHGVLFNNLGVEVGKSGQINTLSVLIWGQIHLQSIVDTEHVFSKHLQLH